MYNIQLGRRRSDLYTGYVGERTLGFGAGARECGNQVMKRRQGKDSGLGGSNDSVHPKDASDRVIFLCYAKQAASNE